VMNRMFTKLLAVGACGACLAASALAQPAGRRQSAPGGPPGGAGFAERLKAMDADSDGKISKQEASGRLAQMFSRFDTNADGAIDESEVKAMRERFAAGGPGRAGGAGVVAGATAPDFTLKTVDGQREVTLSSFDGEKPVALIFGSYT
jgi:hypothetical protein